MFTVCMLVMCGLSDELKVAADGPFDADVQAAKTALETLSRAIDNLGDDKAKLLLSEQTDKDQHASALQQLQDMQSELQVALRVMSVAIVVAGISLLFNSLQLIRRKTYTQPELAVVVPPAHRRDVRGDMPAPSDMEL